MYKPNILVIEGCIDNIDINVFCMDDYIYIGTSMCMYILTMGAGTQHTCSNSMCIHTRKLFVHLCVHVFLGIMACIFNT
jgi:hypothetical protein